MNIRAPFSQNQYDFFVRALTSWLNVAEGGKRGSKNVLTTEIFCAMLETHPNKIHLVAGVSSATARLNILDCDGYGLLNYFEGRCYEGKYQDRSCVYVQTKTGTKVVLVSGGGKNGDEKLIKGNTYGMVYITEANECHPNFIQECFDRTLSSADRKIFMDLNPKEPEHWFYTDVIGFHEEQQAIDSTYGYNYGHFTLCDNMSLSDEKIRSILKTYRKGTVWYERDIKGKRVVAEGIIFRYFAEHKEDYLVDDEECMSHHYTKLTMGIDFGGNGSKTVFVLKGYINGYQEFRTLREDALPITEEIDSKQICDKFIECYRRWTEEWLPYRGGGIDWVFPDSASTTMINSLRAVARQNGINPSTIAGCYKNEVAERPKTYDLLLTTGRHKINESCEGVIKAFCNLRWDEKEKDIPEDKNIGNINDYWDAENYTILTFIKYIDLQRR